MKLSSCIFALVLVCLPALVRAEELPCAPKWMPRWLCVCPEPCQKPLPCLDWDWQCRCDDYCKKPLPCVPYCVKYRCDDYDCKAEPCCYPRLLCPVPIR